MNSSILKKVIEELGKESPNLDYIRGMLETLSEIQEPMVVNATATAIPAKVTTFDLAKEPATDIADEGILLDNKARVNLAAVQRMAHESTELQ